MNSQKLLSDSVEAEALKMPTRSQKQQLEAQKSQTEKMTLGQRLADNLAAKVGSWSFLIAQTGVLSAWVGCNLMPGVPHWDESPFILLNLVFSFASAYTAPVVVMIQNRQSEEDRESANHNYQVTLQAAQNIELLHEKLDAEYAKKLDELTVLIKQQQQAASEVKVVFVPTHSLNEFEHHSKKIATIPILNTHSKKRAS